MINKPTLYKAGAITFIILGLLHLNAHFGMGGDEKASQLMLEMEAYKIQLFGEHNLLKFHNGFSIMMAFLFSAWGLQNFFGAESILKSKKALYSSIFTAAVSFVIAFIYFHVLAYAFILFSLVCFTVAAVKSGKGEISRVAPQKN